MNSNLTGKIVLITGAAKGIGRETALAFAREGAHLALLDIDQADLESLWDEAAKIGLRVSVADLSTGSGVAQGISSALAGLYRR